MDLEELNKLLEFLIQIIHYLTLISEKIKNFLLTNNLPLPILFIAVGVSLLIFREISKWVAWGLIGLGIVLLIASL